ncbi:MAG: putative bifunctional diguanylate cyclase/phosphodiesterase [Actinomycetota bacterium]
MRQKQRNNNARIIGFTSIVAVLAVVMWIVGQTLHIRPFEIVIPWPLLTLGFAVADVFTIHIEFKENAHSFSLNEVPLVLGLAFSSPAHLVVARILGGFLALVIARRQRGVKLLFNTTLFALEATSAIALYAVLLSLGTGDVARWIATFGAMIGVNMLASAAVSGVISIASRRRDMSAFKRTLVAGAVTTCATTCLALVSVDLLRSNPFSFGLVLMLSLIMFIGYRGYAALQQRYSNLQRLYDFTGTLSRSAGLEAAVRSSLTRAQELMRAASSRLYLLDHGIVVSTRDDELTTEPIDETEEDWVWNCVIEDGLPVLLSRVDRAGKTKEYLERHGLKDMMMAPLVHRGQVIGALAVHNRLGEVSTFDDEDRKVFETLANHASVSIQNSRLIDQLREEVDAKNHQALHDMLTGLGNRRMFGERTDEALALADHRANGAAVLLLDLNRFKDVNDSLGHHCGDMLLKEVGERLRGAIPKDATVCRLGGDEFAVLLPSIEDGQEAVEAAAAISAALEEPYKIQDLALGVGAAIGVAISPEHGRDSATLLRHADVAMYQSKESHTAEVYDPERDQASARRLALAVELREAIEQEHLEVYFQPKVSLMNGKPVGAEALLRWERPGHGFVSPEEFVPLAESVGLMRPMTILVLKRALAQALKWEQAGYPIGVAVNLSARSILDLGLPEEIALLLAQTGLQPKRLTLEITEGQLVSDQSRTINVLERLAALGVSLSIDDFGTGYSSLSYLQRLPVNEIKIDKSFVLTMASHVGNASIVRSVIDLARNLGLRVVAEGVEDKDTLDALTDLGCHVAQGYFISRPVPAHEFMRWLVARPVALPGAVAPPAPLRVVNG